MFRLPRLAAIVALIALVAPPGLAKAPPPPILLVHGNGESSAFWMTFKWRLEANGYPSGRIFALDLTNPLARSSGVGLHDGLETPGRSSTSEAREELAAAVEAIRRSTGAPKVVLIGHSRAGNTIRDYLWRGGEAQVEKAVLAATPVNGIVAVEVNPQSEFNGNGDYLRSLNGRTVDVPPGVPTLALRSDANDVWAQVDGRFAGLPGQAVGAGPASPAVRGGLNKVLPGADHKEAALGPAAFREIYAFVAGKPPRVAGYGRERQVVLDGRVRAFANGAPSNRPVAEAKVEVYEVSPATGERLGGPRHSAVTGADGRWGPFRARPGAHYEFVVEVRGYPVTHVYRQPFPRSSDLVALSPTPLQAGEAEAGALIVMKRPRGLFGPGRDIFTIDGVRPTPRAEGVYRQPADPADPVPATSAQALRLVAAIPRAVETRLNRDRIVVRSWPAPQHVTVAEYHE